MYEWFKTEDPNHPTIRAHLQALAGEVVQLEAVRGDSVFSTVLTPLHDENGLIIGVAGLLTDITEQKKAYESIRHMSYHDQLTDLYNRHYFEHVKKELKELSVISVIMTDINGLKLINDTYGHEAGDELLKEYARILKGSFKKSDFLFRWGGDEFVVVLKNTAEATSWELCNRLIRRCSETIVKDLPLSISVGISSKLRGEDVSSALCEAENMMYKNKLTESKSSKNLIMKTLLQTLSEKSFETKAHIERMSDLGTRLGLSLNLPPSELSRLSTLIMLHDIGKINIDSHILLKTTALNESEWAEIKKHPEVGYRITRTAEEFAYVAEEILSHHERWDGQGYPQGLAGDNIPYLARILALIDSFDVMRNGRPYKKNMEIKEIIAEIERCSGSHFDPVLARQFIKFIIDEFNEEYKGLKRCH
jgi:diguanylate cyclase (GGDEF)-like protein